MNPIQKQIAEEFKAAKRTPVKSKEHRGAMRMMMYFITTKKALGGDDVIENSNVVQFRNPMRDEEKYEAAAERQRVLDNIDAFLDRKGYART